MKVLEIEQKEKNKFFSETIPPLDAEEMQESLQSSQAMDFLIADEEDIYS